MKEPVLKTTSDLANTRNAWKPGGVLIERYKELKTIQEPLRDKIDSLVLEMIEQTHPIR